MFSPKPLPSIISVTRQSNLSSSGRTTEWESLRITPKLEDAGSPPRETLAAKMASDIRARFGAISMPVHRSAPALSAKKSSSPVPEPMSTTWVPPPLFPRFSTQRLRPSS